MQAGDRILPNYQHNVSDGAGGRILVGYTAEEQAAAEAELASPAPATSFIVGYETFQDRFTTAELDGMADFIYETNTATGKPKRQAIIQAYQRAVAANSVDLLAAKTDTFLSALVAAGVVTAARKTAILDPTL